MQQSVMALHALSPAHSSGRADGVPTMTRGARAMNAAGNQGSQTLPSQQMQLYNIHRLLVSSGRGRGARKCGSPGGKVHQDLIAQLGVSLHPAALSCTCLSQRH